MSPKIAAVNVQVFIVDADYPRINSPLPPDHESQPDLHLELEVDVHGVAVPSPPPGLLAIPDYRELERLLLEPIAQAIAAAL